MQISNQDHLTSYLILLLFDAGYVHEKTYKLIQYVHLQIVRNVKIINAHIAYDIVKH